MGKDSLRILFLGFAIPDDVMEEVAMHDPFPQVQANKLQWNLLRGLYNNGVENIDVLSSMPVFDYPHSPYFIAKGPKFNQANIAGRIFPYINVVVLKHLSRFIMCFAHVYNWLIKHPGEETDRRILVYGLNSSYLYALVLIKLFFKIKIINIITDIPIDDDFKESRFRRFLRKIDKNLLWFGMKKMDAAIVLTYVIAKDYVPSLPSFVLEGMIEPFNEQTLETKDEFNTTIPPNLIVYTGAISESYGVQHLVGAFKKLDLGYTLWIFGKGDYVEELSKQIEGNQNIKYWGFVKDNKFVQKVSSLAKILVIPRNPQLKVTKYCFPSKLLEYMNLGAPVILTNMEGIPEEYKAYTYMVEDGADFEFQLYKKIMEVCAKPENELMEMASNARQFVKDYKNPLYQTNKLLNFIKNV